VTDIADLERRVAALEAAQNETTESQRWMAATLGRIAAVQDEHTMQLKRLGGRLDNVDSRLDKVDSRLDRVEGEMKSMREDIKALPSILAETMREVLRDGK